MVGGVATQSTASRGAFTSIFVLSVSSSAIASGATKATRARNNADATIIRKVIPFMEKSSTNMENPFRDFR
jgi:hypothetical protein